jgi:uncharacterized protein YndB with AHSA1/START domain
MARYCFITTWQVPAAPEKVWDALITAEDYPRWWPSIVSCRSLTPGVRGLGAKAERAVRGRLPYTLRYTTTITHFDPPREAAYDALGDLVGKGRFIVSPAGTGTRVVFHWEVQTTGFWLNLLAPLFRWLFAWNHNRVMAEGERGLCRWLRNR